jgi:putative transposase
MKEIPWAVSNNALQDLDNAFSHFFRRVKLGQKPGYPRFKSKKRSTPSFAIEARALRFDGRRIKLPKLGWVRTRQELRFPGKILSARFTKRAGHWYVSIMVEIDESRWSYPHRCETQAAVGIDRGVVDLAVLSSGEKIEAPRVLRQYEDKLRQLNKELSRRTKGGQNWQKTKAKLGRLHERIANIRRDVTHKLTTSIVRRFRWIGIEDLCVKGMARTRLAKSIMDAAMAEVGRQLNYKAPLAGSTIVRADRFYPSSKTCSVCGVVYADLVLGERRWTCDTCGADHDRDVNAAKNLEALAAALAVTACRQGSAGPDLRVGTKLPLGQESSSAVNSG